MNYSSEGEDSKLAIELFDRTDSGKSVIGNRDEIHPSDLSLKKKIKRSTSKFVRFSINRELRLNFAGDGRDYSDASRRYKLFRESRRSKSSSITMRYNSPREKETTAQYSVNLRRLTNCPRKDRFFCVCSLFFLKNRHFKVFQSF